MCKVSIKVSPLGYTQDISIKLNELLTNVFSNLSNIIQMLALINFQSNTNVALQLWFISRPSL